MLPRAVRALALAGAAALLWSCERDGAHEPASRALTTSDGWELGVTAYRPAGEDRPGVVLVHDAGGNRSAWRDFATAAQHAGYFCMAIDLRGHGDSALRDGATRSYREFDADDWAGLTRDVAAAMNGLVDAGADPENLAAIGAGVGGSAALAVAASLTQIQGVAIVSPGLELKGFELVSIMEEFPKKPILLMASEGDSYAASTCSTLNSLAEGYCEVRTYPGTSNGLDLLALSDGARGQLIQWLDEVVGGGHGANGTSP